MITVLFLYRPVAWCFYRGMKKAKIILVASIVVAAVLIKTQTNRWRTKIDYYKDGSKELANPYAQIVKALLRFSLVRSSNSTLC